MAARFVVKKKKLNDNYIEIRYIGQGIYVIFSENICNTIYFHPLHLKLGEKSILLRYDQNGSVTVQFILIESSNEMI